MNDYDGLNLCAECGDAYTTGTLCHNCARQRAIDNDPMAGYDAIHYDTMYGYDDDEYDDDEPLYRSYADDFAFPDTYYDDDDTMELTIKGKLELLRMRIAYRWRTFWELRSSRLKYRIHKLRMRYDTHYATHYWDDIPF